MCRVGRARVACVAVWLLGIAACVSAAKLREDARLIEKKIASARERGAHRCAGPELASAEAELEFLDYELREGDLLRAQRHHDQALHSVNEALRGTDPNTCAAKRVIIREDSDRDGDGVLDGDDQCPDEPEDRDRFEDENGCPDPDNDADTVPDTEDKCPNEPGTPKRNGCPAPDRDGDGLADDTDLCPDIPEDLDGNQDDDGCPEEESRDSDNDTVLDEVDACPLQPGPANNKGCPLVDRDGDGLTDDIDQCPDVPGGPPTGCPGRVLVVKTDSKIEIKKQIRFASGKATIEGSLSFQILDQVSSVLKSNPLIKVVIEGHTDGRGAADYNLRLSDDRAKAVRRALVERGVAADRLEAIGYGESKPIASNKSKKGRAANRRVDFLIVQSN